jgi:hypothetical protein
MRATLLPSEVRAVQRLPKGSACAKLPALPPCAADALMGNIIMFPTATLLSWPFAHNSKAPRRFEYRSR